MKNQSSPNRWKGFLLGMVGSLAGLGAMDLYWKRVAPWVSAKLPRPQTNEEEAPSKHVLDDISIAGPMYKEDESSTEALGRIAHKAVTGSAPRSKEGLNILSYLVHYIFGIFQGGVYGAYRSKSSPQLDLFGGGMFGAGLWLLVDELVVPLLGLQKGPKAVPLADHVNRLGAHLSYGFSTALVTQLLRKYL